MLKFLHVAWIFNFCIFLADLVLISNMSLSPDFKHIVLSRLDKLLGLRYIAGKFQMSSFYPNLNQRKIPPIALDMSQTVHDFDIFDNISLLTLTLWNIMFPISIWLENLPQCIFMYLIFPCQISALSNIRFERYAQSRKTNQQIF